MTDLTHESDFASLGEFAPAGLEATRLALRRAERSLQQGRIPIAGAAVSLADDGQLTTVAIGHNGRIPEPGGDDIGYPTDHGETAAIRQIEDIGAWDWSRIVFATTLSPCIMCTRALMWLQDRGLNKIVIAESQTFPGAKTLLKRQSETTLVELTNQDAVSMMQQFARIYPWDWAADIGDLAPEEQTWEASRSWIREPARFLEAAVEAMGDTCSGAAVFDSKANLLAAAGDGRCELDGNPCRCAVMRALGDAGSAANLRECLVAFASADPHETAELDRFGHAALGACQLFRPAALVSNCPLERPVAAHLQSSRIRLWMPPWPG